MFLWPYSVPSFSLRCAASKRFLVTLLHVSQCSQSSVEDCKDISSALLLHECVCLGWGGAGRVACLLIYYTLFYFNYFNANHAARLESSLSGGE